MEVSPGRLRRLVGQTEVPLGLLSVGHSDRVNYTCHPVL
jgi:hypothetical protein